MSEVPAMLRDGENPYRGEAPEWTKGGEVTFGGPGDKRKIQLLCAHCGGDYTHHTRIDVYERIEDAEEGIHVCVDRGKVWGDDDMHGNPSGRRTGVTVTYYCEHCDHESVLKIAQHKGGTYVTVEPGREILNREQYLDYQHPLVDEGPHAR